MSAIVTNGLIGHWHHKQGFNGSTWDNISPNTQGQWQGIVNGVVSQPDGLFFDGIDDFIEITRPNSSHSYMTNFTFEAFVKPNVSGYNPLFYSHYINHFSINSNDMLHLKGTNENTGVTSNSGIAKDMWYTLTFTVGNGKFSLYIDGILVGEKTTNGYITIYGYVITAYPLLIGRIIGSGSSATEGKFNGLIKSARMYDRTLTPQEITQNHDEDLRELMPPPPPQIVTDGLVGYWHYKQGVVGNTWGNISPNTRGEHDGVINGATLQSDGMYFNKSSSPYHEVTISSLPTSLSTGSLTFELELTPINMGIGRDFLASYKSISRWSAPYYNITNRYDNVIVYRSQPSSSEFTDAIAPAMFGQSSFIQMRYDKSIDRGDIYHNGVKVVASKQIWLRLYDSINIGYYSGEFKVKFLRIYDRFLTDQEIAQNYSVGTEVGLPQTPVSSPPKVTVVSASKQKISDEPNMDRSIVTFKFDKDVTQWTVNVLGASHDTGFVADSGGTVIAGTEIVAEIDWTELQQEGQNKVNIYGKDSDGNWTPYST